MAEQPPAPPLLRDFQAGETVFHENEHGQSMFIVIAGTVRLSLSSMDVEDVEAGGFLGEMSLLEDEPRTTSAIAITDCSLQEIDRAAFLFRVTQMPFFAIRVLRTMAHRIRRMDKHVNRDTRFGRATAKDDVTPSMIQAAKLMTTVPKGAFILRQNEDGTEMFCLRRGKAELRVNSIVVETVGVGGILGELALLDKEPRTATAVATEECDVLVYDLERFEYLLAMTPNFAFRLMTVLARRLRSIDRAIADQS